MIDYDYDNDYYNTSQRRAPKAAVVSVSYLLIVEPEDRRRCRPNLNTFDFVVIFLLFRPL